MSTYLNQIQEEALDFDPDAFLYDVLSEHNIRRSPEFYDVAVVKRNMLREFLIKKFKHLLAGNPVYWGSTARGTAIGKNFDFDLILPFSRNSFHSLEEMYETVYEVIYEHFAGYEVEVRKQKKSIGITFFENDSELHFDIVPGREITNYRSDKKLNLYVRPDSFWSYASRMKTNLDVHKK